MRLVIDTNVLVSAFLWQGTPGRLIGMAGEQDIRLFTSRSLLDELAATLCKQKLTKAVTATGLTVDEILRNYRHLATRVRVTARQLERQVSRDSDDDQVIACALAARADVIVSGDTDLLCLITYRNISIVTPAQALTLLTRP